MPLAALLWSIEIHTKAADTAAAERRRRASVPELGAPTCEAHCQTLHTKAAGAESSLGSRRFAHCRCFLPGGGAH